MKLQELPEHHAVLLTHSNRKDLADGLWEELRADSLSHRFFDQTVLDIDRARQIISWARSAYGGKRIGLISFHTIGIPAQNALLKILEEPEVNTRFVLITSNKANLIDTVLSRLHHHVLHDTESEDTEYAKLFLKTNPTERIKLPFVTALLAKTDEEDRKDREALHEFIISIASLLSRNKSTVQVVPELFEIASYARDPSSSGKALIEYISLLLPQIKD